MAVIFNFYVCRYCLFNVMFTVSAVVQFQICSEVGDYNSINVLEGQQFKICVCKGKVVAQNVLYVMHLLQITATSKEALGAMCCAWCGKRV